jgi:hypothetical protein
VLAGRLALALRHLSRELRQLLHHAVVRAAVDLNRNWEKHGRGGVHMWLVFGELVVVRLVGGVQRSGDSLAEV